MRHIKTTKDSRGKFRIEVSIWTPTHHWETDINGNSHRYDVYVEFTPKGKRKPLNENHIDMISEEDLHACKVELWKKLEP